MVLPLLAIEAQSVGSQIVYYTPSELIKIKILGGLFCVASLIVIGVLYRKYRKRLNHSIVVKQYSEALAERERMIEQRMQEDTGISRGDVERLIPAIEAPAEVTNPEPDTSTRKIIIIVALVVIAVGVITSLM